MKQILFLAGLICLLGFYSCQKNFKDPAIGMGRGDHKGGEGGDDMENKNPRSLTNGTVDTIQKGLVLQRALL